MVTCEMTTSCWTQDIYDYAHTSPPEGDDAAAIQTLLCIPWSTFIPPDPDALVTLRTWLQKNPDLCAQYPQSALLRFTDDVRRLAGPLMCWGASQTWGRKMQVQSLVEQWVDVLDQPNLYSDALASDMAISTTLLLDALPRMARGIMAEAAKTWATMLLDLHTLLWSPSMYSEAVRAQVFTAWCDLYAIAQAGCPQDVGHLWNNCVTRAFQQMSPAAAGQALLALVCSRLPEAAQIQALGKASARTWLLPEVQAELVPLFTRMFPDGETRLHFLPWSSLSGHGRMDDEYPDTNRRLCETYCSELAAIFALYPISWKDRVDLLKLVQAQRPKEPVDTISISGLLDPSPT